MMDMGISLNVFKSFFYVLNHCSLPHLQNFEIENRNKLNLIIMHPLSFWSVVHLSNYVSLSIQEIKL